MREMILKQQAQEHSVQLIKQFWGMIQTQGLVILLTEQEHWKYVKILMF